MLKTQTETAQYHLIFQINSTSGHPQTSFKFLNLKKLLLMSMLMYNKLNSPSLVSDKW